MNVASEMQALCDNIVSASVNRANRLGSLRHEVAALRRDARLMVSSFHDAFGAMSRGWRSGLRNETAARKKAVAGLRVEFRNEIRAVGADLAAAKEIWAAMGKKRGD